MANLRGVKLIAPFLTKIICRIIKLLKNKAIFKVNKTIMIHRTRL